MTNTTTLWKKPRESRVDRLSTARNCAMKNSIHTAGHWHGKQRATFKDGRDRTSSRSDAWWQGSGHGRHTSRDLESNTCYCKHSSMEAVRQNLGEKRKINRLVRTVFLLVPKKGNVKECSNSRTISLIMHISEGDVKNYHSTHIPQMRQSISEEQAGFMKKRGTHEQIINTTMNTRSARNSTSCSTCVSLITQSTLLCMS